MPDTIALSGLFLDYPFSGTWTYTRNLARALPRVDPVSRYTLWTRYGEAPPDVSMTTRTAPSPFVGLSTSSWRARIDKLYWEVVAWPWAARRSSLLHSLYFAAPVLAPAPLVVTIHDVIPLRNEGYVRSRAAGWYGALMRQLCQRAAAIITVSNVARDDIADTLGYPVERILVTPEAPDPALAPVTDGQRLDEVRKRYGLPDRFVLYLGGSERRKNVETLLHTWADAKTEDIRLVLVGRFPAQPDALYPDVPGLISRLRLGARVQIVPTVAPQDLAAVYSASLAFCFPSRYEGFGLPPLEAMACGTPVLCSDASSLRETAGGGAHLVHADDVGAWTLAIERIIEDRRWREELAARGLAHAGSFTWEKTARATRAVYTKVLEA